MGMATLTFAQNSYTIQDFEGHWILTSGLAFPFDSMIGHFSMVDSQCQIASVNRNSSGFRKGDVWWKDFQQINDSTFSYQQLFRFNANSFFYSPGTLTFLKRDSIQLNAGGSRGTLTRMPFTNYESFEMPGRWRLLNGNVSYSFLGMQGEVQAGADSCTVTFIDAPNSAINEGDTWWRGIVKSSDSTFIYQNVGSSPAEEYEDGTISIIGDDYIILEYCPSANSCVYYTARRMEAFETTSVPDGSAKISLSIAPNPAPGAFSLTSPTAAIQSIELYDLTGRRLPAEISHDRHEAQVRSRYRGLALVKVLTEQGMWVQKVRME